jgi:hypothetical protein
MKTLFIHSQTHSNAFNILILIFCFHFTWKFSFDSIFRIGERTKRIFYGNFHWNICRNLICCWGIFLSQIFLRTLFRFSEKLFCDSHTMTKLHVLGFFWEIRHIFNLCLNQSRNENENIWIICKYFISFKSLNLKQKFLLTTKSTFLLACSWINFFETFFYTKEKKNSNFF